ncbi:hypothetical protein HYE34_00960 [Mycoplasmopsis bovis]|nr:hypothetical protein HYE34_00960 [Mycoplasmopsis bovis]
MNLHWFLPIQITNNLGFKKFYLKNNAHHIYYPPIDLSRLPIETRHKINIDYSKGTHKQNAEKISEFINTKIHDEFKKYNQDKTTPIEIDKDVKISNYIIKLKEKIIQHLC